jgi:hypothetical protein
MSLDKIKKIVIPAKSLTPYWVQGESRNPKGLVKTGIRY